MSCSRIGERRDALDDRRRYLTVREVAEMWGVSVDKIYADVKKGALLAYSVSGSIRIRYLDALGYGRPLGDSASTEDHR